MERAGKRERGLSHEKGELAVSVFGELTGPLALETSLI